MSLRMWRPRPLGLGHLESMLLYGVGGSDLGAAHCRDAQADMLICLASFQYPCCLIHFRYHLSHTHFLSDPGLL